MYDMHLTRFETSNEYNYVINLLKNNWAHHFTSSFTIIGGTNVGSPHQWYWAQTGKSMDYNMEWFPGMPDNWKSMESCLSLVNEKGEHQFKLNDIVCEAGENQFICEKIEMKQDFCEDSCRRTDLVINA